MKRISFALTIPQFEDGTKDVTRRLGWRKLTPGTRLLAVDKVMGWPRGHRGGGRVLGEIEVVAVRREPLHLIDDDDVRREGFPDRNAAWFVQMSCRQMRCAPDTVVARIEFRKCDA